MTGPQIGTQAVVVVHGTTTRTAPHKPATHITHRKTKLYRPQATDETFN